ncbi:MAG: hypothetical protein OEW12_02760 [Deltaproteobacteria bacterium]|nr:hypothetical protein [Deltaproteobacteria bacterium]
MKKLSIGLLATAAILFSANAASAEMLFSVAADKPFAYKFGSNHDGSSVDSTTVDGGKLAVKFPILVGIGLEKFTVNTKYVGSTTTLKYDFNIVDIFYQLPVPVVNLTVGAGIGTAKMQDLKSGVNVYSTGTAGVSQLYVEAGFPIIPMLDVHLGYHAISTTKVTYTQDGTTIGNAFSLGGQMYTVGMMLSF